MVIQEFGQIPISSIVVRRALQVRSTYGKSAMRDLTKSVREEGVIQGIIVRPYKNGRKELVFGSRRLKAARRAGRKVIPAIVATEISDKDAIVLALHENLHREELDPFEEARAILKLVRIYKMGIQEIAKKVGRNSHFVKKRLKLLKMPKEVQLLVAEKKIPIGHADMLASLPVAQQREVAENASRHKLGARDLQVHIQDTLGVSPRVHRDVADWSPEKIQLRIKDFGRFLKAVKPVITEMGPIDILNIRIALEKLSEESGALALEFKRLVVI